MKRYFIPFLIFLSTAPAPATIAAEVSSSNTSAAMVQITGSSKQTPINQRSVGLMIPTLTDTRNGSHAVFTSTQLTKDIAFTPNGLITEDTRRSTITCTYDKGFIVTNKNTDPIVGNAVDADWIEAHSHEIAGTLTFSVKAGYGAMFDYHAIRFAVQRFLEQENLNVLAFCITLEGRMGVEGRSSSNIISSATAVFAKLFSGTGVTTDYGDAKGHANTEPLLSATFVLIPK